MDFPAKEQQKQLSALAQAFAHMDNPLREDLIRHQWMEQNYDSAHELLEELESDIADLQDIEDHMETVHDQIQVLRDNVQQGYFDLGTFELCAPLWVLPGETAKGQFLS